jgi:ABC-2 type transport system ATP-binding protein/lipopolysaccharide transport system ATP-binding protein
MTTSIDISSLSKRFLLRHNRAGELKVRFLGLFHRRQRETVEELWALKDVSITIGRGESVGLVGRNGSGKSTLLKLIAGIDRPTSGRLLMAAGGRVGTLIELGVGFHPELTGQENVYLNAAVHGLTQAETDAIYPAIVEYADLADFMDVPLKNYSSGMQMRVGFAVAANLDPDILLLDEIFAVGDENFQNRCRRTVNRFLAEGKTVLFVSHSQDAIRAICRRLCLLEHGRLLFDGDVEQGFLAYHRLLTSVGHWGPAGSESRPEATQSPDDGTDVSEQWHRIAVGGQWNTIGSLQFEFLRSQGLKRSDCLLDVGCGSLRAGVYLIPYLDPGHYVGFDYHRELVQAGLDHELPREADRRKAMFVIDDKFNLSGLREFDVVFAHAFFPHVSLNVTALCIAAVIKKLAPQGRFFATYYESPDAASSEPVVQAGGNISYPNAVPYHTSFEVLASLCAAAGGHAERIGAWGDPNGQMMLVITRQPSRDVRR